MFKYGYAILIGLMSSVAFADLSPAPSTPIPVQTINYECKFKQQGCEHDGLFCRVKGQLCNELDASNTIRRCQSSQDPIEIECSNGFELDSRDASINFDNGTLWINADARNRIATIRVKDIITSLGEIKRDADLIIARGNNAAILEGACEFRY